MNCPCGSGNSFEACCGLYISGEKQAPTPEALMRSRYSAYVTNNLDYIEKTMRGAPLQDFDRGAVEEAQKEMSWLKLVILQATQDGEEGTVQFIASYRFKEQEYQLCELSHFQRIDGSWYYVKGITS